jgi:hypothetical protein
VQEEIWEVGQAEVNVSMAKVDEMEEEEEYRARDMTNDWNDL